MSRSKRGGEPERQAETKLRFEQLSMEFIDDSAARLCQNQSQFHADLQKFVEESKRIVQTEQEKNRYWGDNHKSHFSLFHALIFLFESVYIVVNC